MSRKDLLFIKDILKAINSIETFIEGLDFREFCDDDKTRSAVVWQIHIIGEAVKNVSSPIRDKYADVPWKYIARMRDKIAHFYFGIDYEIVWDVVMNKLPKLKPQIEKILKDIDLDN